MYVNDCFIKHLTVVFSSGASYDMVNSETHIIFNRG